jgi:hypothetical protein
LLFTLFVRISTVHHTSTAARSTAPDLQCGLGPETPNLMNCFPSSPPRNSSSRPRTSQPKDNVSNSQEKYLEFLPTGGKLFPSAPCRCNYCHIDITQYLRISCNECENFLLCADCYCSGVELFPHKPTHSYRIVDCLHYPIFQKEWTIAEELLLLEGIEKHGIGNWKTISDYVGTKTPRACGDHYWHDYFGKFGSCLPSQTISPEQQTLV